MQNKHLLLSIIIISSVIGSGYPNGDNDEESMPLMPKGLLKALETELRSPEAALQIMNKLGRSTELLQNLVEGISSEDHDYKKDALDYNCLELEAGFPHRMKWKSMMICTATGCIALFVTTFSLSPCPTGS